MKQLSISHQELIRLLNRPIAFHRCFVAITGSITAALFLSQALYWHQRNKRADGYWYKTREQWNEETGMTRREQETARRKLRKLKLIDEKRKGVPAQLWFRLDEDRLIELLVSKPASVGTETPLQLVQKRPTGGADSAQQVGTNSPNKKAQNRPTFKGTETTTEISTETTTTTSNFTMQHNHDGVTDLSSSRGSQNKNNKNTSNSRWRNAVSEKAFNEECHKQKNELFYPSNLTDQEKNYISTQIEPLPIEIAQQMLDVLQSKISTNELKTNSAAFLNGIIRKYKIDPTNFDPSPGFQVSENRSRRSQSNARLMQEAKEREIDREKVRGASKEARSGSISEMRKALGRHALNKI